MSGWLSPQQMGWLWVMETLLRALVAFLPSGCLGSALRSRKRRSLLPSPASSAAARPSRCGAGWEVRSEAPAAAGSGTCGLSYVYALRVINTQQKVISSKEILFKNCRERIFPKC